MEWIITLHSYWRWVILIIAAGAIIVSLMSAFGNRPWDTLSDRLSLFFTIAMDVQFLIGIIVWITDDKLGNDPILRFLHPLAMIGAIALAHIGRVRSERAQTAQDKGKQAGLFFIASLVVVLIAIPLASWPV